MMKAPTKTQLQIAQELRRHGSLLMATRQDEYLKLRPGWGVYLTSTIIWVGRRGEIRLGRRLSSSWEDVSSGFRKLKREAKENYVEERENGEK